MEYAYAWVTLTAKVYVPKSEIEALVEIGQDLEGEPIKSEDEAFGSLATKKIWDHFPTDDPMKLEEVEIDLSTYTS